MALILLNVFEQILKQIGVPIVVFTAMSSDEDFFIKLFESLGPTKCGKDLHNRMMAEKRRPEVRVAEKEVLQVRVKEVWMRFAGGNQ